MVCCSMGLTHVEAYRSLLIVADEGYRGELFKVLLKEFFAVAPPCVVGGWRYAVFNETFVFRLIAIFGTLVKSMLVVRGARLCYLFWRTISS